MLKHAHDNQFTRAPFLTNYASVRTSSPEITGDYSDLLAMWVVNICGKEVPLIDYQNSAVELITKTLAQRENDDQGGMLAAAELATKTDIQAEQDDASASACLEMATKTEAEMEHDDTSSEAMGMFL
ncbi:MAG: hypothetical protein JAZ11_02865 [Candidatus Thiodiazotropha lotti]|nr:hypothetical protein [Candidatus Thiodiazotropha lotti]